MGRFRTVAPLLLLAGAELALARPGMSAPGVGASARQLALTVDSALAGVAKAAGESRQVRLAPFVTALDRMRRRIRLIEGALGRRGDELFLLLDEGSSDLGSLRVVWARTGLKIGPVSGGLRIASASYRLLRANYGRAGLRQRQGGGLSDAERRHFQRLQRAERRFAESLKPLAERAQQRGDVTTAAELDRFRREAELIAWAPLELEAYLDALLAGGEIRGEWAANAPYVRKSASPELTAAADDAVQDLYVEAGVGHVFTLDLGASRGASPLDQVSELEPGEVQVYQAAGGEVVPPADDVAEPLPDEPEVEPEAGPQAVDEAEPEVAAEEPAEPAEDEAAVDVPDPAELPAEPEGAAEDVEDVDDVEVVPPPPPEASAAADDAAQPSPPEQVDAAAPPPRPIG